MIYNTIEKYLKIKELDSNLTTKDSTQFKVRKCQ